MNKDMVYVGQNGEKYEVQMAVVLREGSDAGITKYVWTSKERVQGFLSKFKFGEGVASFVDMMGIVESERGKLSDKIHFKKGKLSSLVFDCRNEETANVCAKYYGFPEPFVKRGETYKIRQHLDL